MAEQDTPPPTITAMKIPIIRKGEYDIWSMRMRQYICHTDHNLWDVIVNGDLEEEPAPTGDQSGPSAPPVPKTAKQLAAKRNKKCYETYLAFSNTDEYLLSFHNVTDAKSLWAFQSKKVWRVYEDEMIRFFKFTLSNFSELEFLQDIDLDQLAINEDDLEELDLRWQVEKGTLLGNIDLEGIKREDLMVTMAGAMHQQMNLHHSSGGSRKWSRMPLSGVMILNEISLSVFDVRTSDEESIPANDRFSKADGYHVVNTNEANIQNLRSLGIRVNRDKVIIKDWNSEMWIDVSEVQTDNPV
ncbi:hypothetical protein Tco_0656813 [Tanacetum coccineum]|uniref:DUF4219 domain-containing protein n=1 Tax=Tanacetum coccineum TaxID=301880 RepID=A0ABQ4X9U1_9ASTR